MNIGSQPGGLPVLIYALMRRKVTTTDMIQNMVDNTNMAMVIAKSHFRDRVRSPLVLFNHENLLRKNCHQVRLDEGLLTP